jgi:hypothetical protein
MSWAEEEARKFLERERRKRAERDLAEWLMWMDSE